MLGTDFPALKNGEQQECESYIVNTDLIEHFHHLNSGRLLLLIYFKRKRENLSHLVHLVDDFNIEEANYYSCDPKSIRNPD